MSQSLETLIDDIMTDVEYDAPTMCEVLSDASEDDQFIILLQKLYRHAKSRNNPTYILRAAQEMADALEIHALRYAENQVQKQQESAPSLNGVMGVRIEDLMSRLNVRG